MIKLATTAAAANLGNEVDEADKRAVAAIANGSVNDVGALYDRYAHKLLARAQRILCSVALAEDAVHDTFVHACERARQYEPARGSVVAWLFTILRNLCLDRARTGTRRDRRLREVSSQESLFVGSSDTRDAEASLVEWAERARVRKALTVLDPFKRRTLEAVAFEGLSLPALAAREGVPLGTIKSRMARALIALAEVLSHQDAGIRQAS